LSDKSSNYMRKLGRKWLGPFLLIKQVTPVSYLIQTGRKNQVEKKHVSDLKPFHEPESFPKSPLNYVSLNPKHLDFPIQKRPQNSRKNGTSFPSKQSGSNVRLSRQKFPKNSTDPPSYPSGYNVRPKRVEHVPGQYINPRRLGT